MLERFSAFSKQILLTQYKKKTIKKLKSTSPYILEKYGFGCQQEQNKARLTQAKLYFQFQVCLQFPGLAGTKSVTQINIKYKIITVVNTTLTYLLLRFAYNADQVKKKPGREVVTFLLVCNLAMWAINSLETNRADSHPIQVPKFPKHEPI